MIDYFHLNMDAEQLLNLSSLGLAHLGDGVYELMVRSWLCLHGKATARNLHRATVGYVAAPAQARRQSASSPAHPEEADVFRRAETPPPTPSPRGQPVGSIRPPPPWRPCSAGSISRAGPTGSTSSSPP